MGTESDETGFQKSAPTTQEGEEESESLKGREEVDEEREPSREQGEGVEFHLVSELVSTVEILTGGLDGAIVAPESMQVEAEVTLGGEEDEDEISMRPMVEEVPPAPSGERDE